MNPGTTSNRELKRPEGCAPERGCVRRTNRSGFEQLTGMQFLVRSHSTELLRLGFATSALRRNPCASVSIRG